ncbi:DUF2950 domain-containing protein [Pararhizobium sp. YC-54]|uniref:DUF2950 domain-containing protein n=1 Tax=Pararhizobium sp. YC-54 TaxID=2986920 RepID=UPI0021F7264B|nr:DUF2950 domain-containing protein [Pararhizobium sp. YC-54]MCV9999627.1 DUF2950 domain-containing protein [Pararhizobium sp. YC-54]
MPSCHKILLRSLSCAVVIATAALAPAGHAQDAGADTAISAYISPQDPPLFATPEEALAAFKATLEGGDVAKLAALLGLDAAKTTDNTGVADAFTAIQAGAKEKLALTDVNDRKVIEVGTERWPFPFPIAKGDDGKWAFDTYVGLEEVANRRVGEDELSAIDTIRAYVAAQETYALADHDGDGVLEYAQKFISSEGAQDGLYWPAEAFGGEESPAGPALADEKALKAAKAGNGFRGYRYRILTRQGEAIAGGAYDYVINGNMVAGFGLVAWPVHYGLSGVKTFVVNKSGIVYEADLGDKTSDIAAKIATFNPNDGWQVVED